MKNAAELSRQLRTEKTPDLAHRRGIVALGLVASASMGVIALYQTGLIKHLPEPPLRMFDADRVDGSAEAYERFSMPDAVLGLGSYAATIGLAAMGGRDRARETPWIPLALAGKISFDVAIFECSAAALRGGRRGRRPYREAIEAFSAAARPHKSPQ